MRPPNYEKSIDRLPGTAAKILGKDIKREALPEDFRPEKEFNQVILLLIDGMGLKQWKKEVRGHEVFKEIEDVGGLHELSSVFPSETAAAIPSIHLGKPPSKHGLLGWETLVEGEVVEPLAFDSEDKKFEDIVLEKPVYREMKSEGIKCASIQPEETVDSKASEYLLGGAEREGYVSLADLGVKLRKAVRQSSEDSYVFAYIPEIDKISHIQGTNSESYRAQVDQLGNMLEEQVFQALGESEAEDVLLMVTSDHGFIDLPPVESPRINLEDFPEVRKKLARAGETGKIKPYGGPRVLHLKIEGNSEKVRETLKDEAVKVFTKEEALERGLFGEGAGKEVKKRLGDLIVVPEDAVVWRENETDYFEWKGFHGGLSEDEMEVPLLLAELSELV